MAGKRVAGRDMFSGRWSNAWGGTRGNPERKSKNKGVCPELKVGLGANSSSPTFVLNHQRDKTVVDVDPAPLWHYADYVGIIHPHGACIPQSSECRVYCNADLGTLHYLHF